MIETHALRRTFRSRAGPVEAVAGVDLRVEAGEVFGFLGPNGAGKTTTLRMLSTLLPPTDGEPTVAGCDLRREPPRVREHIHYLRRAPAYPRPADAARARRHRRSNNWDLLGRSATPTRRRDGADS